MARIKGIRLKGKKRTKLSTKIQLKKMNRIWKSKLSNASVPDPAPGPCAPHSPISEPVQASSSASATDATGGSTEAMNNSGPIPGFIFLCNKKTKPRCFQHQVFGLPLGQKKTVEKIKPGTKLFLFDYGMRLLHGVYEAVSEGKSKLEPNAFDGKFLAQVKFKIVKECLPIPERHFKSAILENYHAGRLKLELTEQQVNTLVSLFRPLSSSSSPERVDMPLPGAAPPQPLLPVRMEDQNLSRVHSLHTVNPQLIHPMQIMQHQQGMAGALVDHVDPSFQHHSIPTPIDLYNAHPQELYSSRVVQEPYSRYISEQVWLQQKHNLGFGNDYHQFPLMREPQRPGHYPHHQELDGWHNLQSRFVREGVLSGENFDAYTSMATNHNTLPTMQPHAPAYGSPELPPYIVSGPYVSSTVQPHPLTFGMPERAYSLSTNPYISSPMQPYAPDGRPQPNYPLPVNCVSTAMQGFAPASARHEDNSAFPTACYASSINVHSYASGSGWLEPNHDPWPANPYATRQPHAPSTGMLMPNSPISSHFSFLGPNQFIN